MNERDFLADRFEANRTHLHAVAYRMLGSVSEADDAVQEAWLRLSRRAEQDELDNLPDPIVSRDEEADPEHEALLADSVGLALLVVLETLTPAERLAFVLHDMFAVPFDEIAPIVGRSPAAARQLASRARQRVQRENTVPDADLDAQREVVEAFLAAARDGDFDRLLALLDSEVVLRADLGSAGSREVRGPDAVAGQAVFYSQVGLDMKPAL